MKFRVAGFKILDNLSGIEACELVGRTCYRSDDKIGCQLNLTPDSCNRAIDGRCGGCDEHSSNRFIRMLIKRGHEAMIEHMSVCLSIDKTISLGFRSLPPQDIKFLSITSDVGIDYLSGNIRAFRELIKKYGSMTVVGVIGSVLYEKYPSLFEDLNIPDYDYSMYHIGIVDVKTLAAEHRYHHEYLSVEFVTDRGITHEQVRHRPASFGQECLSGDTIIDAKGTTIKDLYELELTPYGKSRNRIRYLRSCTEDNEIVANKTIKIFKKQISPVFEVVTKLGYKIKATGNHRFMIPDGSFSLLKNLECGDMVMVNGIASITKLTDDRLTIAYNHEGLSPMEIATEYNVNYRTIIKRLKALGIFVPRKNDKDLAKYNKNHTPDSYHKMRNTLKDLYSSGKLTIWNKGLTEEDHPSVAKQANSLRVNHHNNGRGSSNSNWKGGTDHTRWLRDIPKSGICEVCGRSDDITEYHHIDGDRSNNDDSNRAEVCINCHNKLHHGWHVGTVAHPDEIVSITYVGKEQTYDIEMKAPYHNFVANGFVVHNSSRYVSYQNGIEIIWPCWMKDSLMDKALEDYKLLEFNTSTGSIHPRMSEYDSAYNPEAIFAYVSAVAEAGYAALQKDFGWRPEQARNILPNGLKTQIVITANIKEWEHIFNLRAIGTTGAPHPQMCELMQPLLREVAKRNPEIWEEQCNRMEEVLAKRANEQHVKKK